eukprot:TRINITY_DN3182_c2_g1_i1.p1 TRINITY_DN3182_c2_g1~~TRINITY_DN3182_c2_g1_i1.p1  ORF type:complete len:148 (+),score=24.27 TRINITY_DN3182_c2_g1_i1:61-504(+)
MSSPTVTSTVSSRSVSSIGYAEDEPILRKPVKCFEENGKKDAKVARRKLFAMKKNMKVETDHDVLERMKAVQERNWNQVQLLMLNEQTARDYISSQALSKFPLPPQPNRPTELPSDKYRVDRVPEMPKKAKSRSGKCVDNGQCCTIC